jgi:DNA-binding LacI/PurR family transcriptional regulator
MMIGRRVAGLALIVSEVDDRIVEELTEGEMPVVLYDVGKAGAHVTKIRVDYRKGVDRVVDYLTALSHTDLGLIGHHSALGPIRERYNAVLERAQAASSVATVRQASDADSCRAENAPPPNSFPWDGRPRRSFASTTSWPWAYCLSSESAVFRSRATFP